MVVERHGRDNHIAYGFCLGGIEKGACASSYAHDSHNLIVMGRNTEDMKLAINQVIDHKGGIVTALDGKISAQIVLPIAGLLSEKSVEKTAEEFENVRRAFDEQGYEHFNNIMNFTLLALTCTPVLKLTDRGYLNTTDFSRPALFEEIDED